MNARVTLIKSIPLGRLLRIWQLNNREFEQPCKMSE